MININVEIDTTKTASGFESKVKLFADVQKFEGELLNKDLSPEDMNQSIIINQDALSIDSVKENLQKTLIPKADSEGVNLFDSMIDYNLTVSHKYANVEELVIYRENRATSGGFVTIVSDVPISAEEYAKGAKIHVKICENGSAVKMNDVEVRGMIESVNVSRRGLTDVDNINMNSSYVYELTFTPDIEFYMENRALYAVSNIADAVGTLGGNVQQAIAGEEYFAPTLMDYDIKSFFSEPAEDGRYVRISLADFDNNPVYYIPETIVGLNYNNVLDGRSYMDFLRAPVYGLEKNFIPFQSKIAGERIASSVFLPYTDLENVAPITLNPGFSYEKMDFTKYAISPNSPENNYPSKQAVLCVNSTSSATLVLDTSVKSKDNIATYKCCDANSKPSGFNDLINYFSEIEKALFDLSDTDGADCLGIGNNKNGDVNFATIFSITDSIENNTSSVLIKGEVRGYRLVISATNGCRFSLVGETFVDGEKGRYFRESFLEKSKRQQVRDNNKY